jgi:hypothetical protein
MKSIEASHQVLAQRCFLRPSLRAGHSQPETAVSQKPSTQSKPAVDAPKVKGEGDCEAA